LPVASETALPGCLQDGVHGENLGAGRRRRWWRARRREALCCGAVESICTFSDGGLSEVGVLAGVLERPP
jgi:hypothetical protein